MNNLRLGIAGFIIGYCVAVVIREIYQEIDRLEDLIHLVDRQSLGRDHDLLHMGDLGTQGEAPEGSPDAEGR